MINWIDRHPYHAAPTPSQPWVDSRHTVLGVLEYPILVDGTKWYQGCSTHEKAVKLATSLNERHNRIARLSISQGHEPVLI